MTLDERMRADLSRPDPGTPDASGALGAVRRGATKRRRTHRALGVGAAIVVAAVVAAAVLGVRADDGKIQSGPAVASGSVVLVATNVPQGMELVGVQAPNSGSGASGGGPPFAFMRTYALYNADKTQVERSFQIAVGMGDANTDEYRTGWEATQVRGFPAKLSAADRYTTLVWLDDAGRIFRIIGDITPAEAFDVANGLVVGPSGALEPQLVKPGTLPPGFVHLVDIPNPRPMSFAGRYSLSYSTPSGDATLDLELDTQPTETVEERLLFDNARAVDVRGHRGVFVERVGIGRELRWLEPPNTLVTMSATTLTEEQLRAIAEGLRPITDAEWEQLVRDVGPRRAPSVGGTLPPASVAALPAIGPDVVAARGSIDGNSWQLVVYEVAPATGQTERRFCYELRGADAARQSCFPLRAEGVGVKWMFAEGHLGRWFLLGAAAHGALTELGDNNGDPVLLQVFDDPALPMQAFVAALPDPYNGSLSIRNQEWSLVQLSGPVIDGTRRPFSIPGLPGVYPEFSRLTLPPARPNPAGPATPPNTKPGPAAFCDAVEDFRSHDLVDPATGTIEPEALPYLERMRAVAPAEAQSPIDVLIQWLQQGAPLPKPAEVAQAEFQSTTDWIRRC